MRMRATAIMRTRSSGSTGGRSASGVPSTGTSALIGTLSGCGSRVASWRSISQRSSTLSPIPMIPPQHTEIPALPHVLERAEAIVEGARLDDRAVVLAARVEVVVVRVEPRVLQALRLRRRSACRASRTPRAPPPSRRAPSRATRSNAGPSFTSRHAAPMQKRVEPISFARFALAMTALTSSIFSGPTFVSYLRRLRAVRAVLGATAGLHAEQACRAAPRRRRGCARCTARASSRSARSGLS